MKILRQQWRLTETESTEHNKSNFWERRRQNHTHIDHGDRIILTLTMMTESYSHWPWWQNHTHSKHTHTHSKHGNIIISTLTTVTESYSRWPWSGCSLLTASESVKHRTDSSYLRLWSLTDSPESPTTVHRNLCTNTSNHLSEQLRVFFTVKALKSTDPIKENLPTELILH